ncbi:MAG: hypothetical protein WEC00_00885 [Dongiaceae bacterium]
MKKFTLHRIDAAGVRTLLSEPDGAAAAHVAFVDAKRALTEGQSLEVHDASGRLFWGCEYKAPVEPAPGGED